MPPSLDDSSFIVVGDVFDTDDDDDDADVDVDVDELLSITSERGNADGTLILPSASTPTRVTFTPPSSVGSDVASLDLIHQHQRPLVPDDDDDDDMEGIADPLGLHVDGGPSPNVDGLASATEADAPAPSKFLEEVSPTSGTPWTTGIDQARNLLQDRMPVMTSRRSLLFFYLPVLVAVLGVASYTKHLDTLRLRDLEITSRLREKEHQERIQQLQEEIEQLKKQQSGFTFSIPEPTWLKAKVLDVSAESSTAQTLLKQWKSIKASAYQTVDSLRTSVEKDLEEAKEWWKEKQRIVIEKLETLEKQHDMSWASSHAQDDEAAEEEDVESSSSPDNSNDSNHVDEGGQGETGADTAERKKNGINLMPSKKTILASAAIVTVASVLLGTVIDAIFGNSMPSRLDYDTFDQTFGMPLADFVE